MDPGSDVVREGAGELDCGTSFCVVVAECTTSGMTESPIAGVDGREVVVTVLRSKLVFSRLSLKEVDMIFDCRVVPDRRFCLEAEVIDDALLEPFCAHEAARGKPAVGIIKYLSFFDHG